MAMAQRKASGAEPKATMSPSPNHFTSAPLGGCSLRQQLVKRAEDALGVLVAGPGEELGGTHEVGEVDNH